MFANVRSDDADFLASNDRRDGTWERADECSDASPILRHKSRSVGQNFRAADDCRLKSMDWNVKRRLSQSVIIERDGSTNQQFGQFHRRALERTRRQRRLNCRESACFRS
jgi:hypothetical protein